MQLFSMIVGSKLRESAVRKRRASTFHKASNPIFKWTLVVSLRLLVRYLMEIKVEAKKKASLISREIIRVMLIKRMQNHFQQNASNLPKSYYNLTSQTSSERVVKSQKLRNHCNELKARKNISFIAWDFKL